MTTLEQTLVLEPKCQSTITYFKYSSTGQYLAVADSEGTVQIFTRKEKNYVKVNEFRADEGSVWSITWADSKYGNVIGIGSFKNKVAIFQQINGGWKEIAYHDIHTSSVNWVQFAQAGLKLYAGSSDGQISILELANKAWKTQSFFVGDAAITTFALQQFPLGEVFDEEIAEKIYPRVATASKDQKIKIWVHENQRFYNESTNDKKVKGTTKVGGYSLLKEIPTPKENIRNLLWQPTWSKLQQSLSEVTLLTCSEQGQIKSYKLNIQNQDLDKVTTIFHSQSQIIRISQSLTGNMLAASLAHKQQHEIIVFQQSDKQWEVIKKGKL